MKPEQILKILGDDDAMKILQLLHSNPINSADVYGFCRDSKIPHTSFYRCIELLTEFGLVRKTNGMYHSDVKTITASYSKGKLDASVEFVNGSN